MSVIQSYILVRRLWITVDLRLSLVTCQTGYDKHFIEGLFLVGLVPGNVGRKQTVGQDSADFYVLREIKVTGCHGVLRGVAGCHGMSFISFSIYSWTLYIRVESEFDRHPRYLWLWCYQHLGEGTDSLFVLCLVYVLILNGIATAFDDAAIIPGSSWRLR